MNKIEGLKGKLYDYQKEGVQFLIKNDGRAILADQCGLGKTVQALGYVAHKKIPKTIVVVPCSVKFVWQSECSKWTSLKPLVINSKSDKSSLLEEFKKHDVVIINYDIITKFIDIIIDFGFDCLICDEFQMIKSNKALRTKAVKKIAKNIPSIILLSGTPLLNRSVELFNGLQLIDPTVWNNWWLYTKKYCNGHYDQWGWNCSGSSNLVELRERIKCYFLRRKKEDVLTELPPKQFVNVPIELNGESRFKYDLALNEFAEYLADIKKKTSKEIKKSMQAQKLVRLGELRQISTNGKLESAKEIIQNIIDSGEKIVAFSCYNEILEKLQEKFNDVAVTVIGSTPEFMRGKLVESFQNNPEVKVYLGGIKSSGTGITLTASSNVLFIDMSFTPADMLQAQDRCHRISQKNSVTIYQMLARNTIDIRMLEILKEKQKIFDKLFEEQQEKAKSVNMVDSLIEYIEKESQ